MNHFEAQVPHLNGGASPQKRRPGGPGVTRGRVLVVEDEELVRESLVMLLEAEGYQVSFAENGREALARLYSEGPPDVITLDLRMPVMDGWEFRAIQKQDPKLRLVPVVAISADGSPQAAAISAQAYLQRPVEAKTLLTTIARVIDETEQKPGKPAPPTGWPAPWGQSAANVEHEISNPLYFVLLHLSQAVETLRPSIRALETAEGISLSKPEIDRVKACLRDVASLLETAQMGGERIRETIGCLQRLAALDESRLRLSDSPGR
jgi:CheY-like chemotaxis protein